MTGAEPWPGDIVGGASGMAVLGTHRVPVLPCGVTAPESAPFLRGRGGHQDSWVSSGGGGTLQLLDLIAAPAPQRPCPEHSSAPRKVGVSVITPCLSFPIFNLSPRWWLWGISPASPLSRGLGESPPCGTVALKKAAGSLAAAGWPLRGPWAAAALHAACQGCGHPQGRGWLRPHLVLRLGRGGQGTAPSVSPWGGSGLILPLKSSWGGGESWGHPDAGLGFGPTSPVPAQAEDLGDGGALGHQNPKNGGGGKKNKPGRDIPKVWDAGETQGNRGREEAVHQPRALPVSQRCQIPIPAAGCPPRQSPDTHLHPGGVSPRSPHEPETLPPPFCRDRHL